MAGRLRIGVVIAAYDVAQWIGACLSSLRDQTHADWTAIVVDDGSRDATAAVVAGFANARIRLIGQPNSGVSAARNLGLAEIAGDAILFLDADDWLAPDGLARMAAALSANPSAAAVWGPYALMAGTAVPGDPPQRVMRPRLRCANALEKLLVGNCFANGGHVLVRHSAADRIGRFDTSLSFGEDWEYWVRLALAGPLVPMPGAAPVLFVRQRAAGAYRSRVADLGAFGPAARVIFSNPEIHTRFAPDYLEALYHAGLAEKAWIAGRAMLDAGRRGDGLGLLRWSVRERPTLRRLALLLALYLQGAHVLPVGWGGSSVMRRTPISNVK